MHVKWYCKTENISQLIIFFILINHKTWGLRTTVQGRASVWDTVDLQRMDKLKIELVSLSKQLGVRYAKRLSLTGLWGVNDSNNTRAVALMEYTRTISLALYTRYPSPLGQVFAS